MRGTIEDFYEITGRGTVVGLLVTEGDVRVGDELAVIGSTITATVTGIDFHSLPVPGGIRIGATFDSCEGIPIGAEVTGPRTGSLTSAVPRLTGSPSPNRATN